MSQEISACSQVNHYGMAPGRGRGAPEIDILEAMQGDSSKLPNTNITRPYVSCSLQLAPGFTMDRPVLGHLPKKVRIKDAVCMKVDAHRSYMMLVVIRAIGTLIWNTGILQTRL